MLNFVLHRVGRREGFVLFGYIFVFLTSNYVVIFTNFYNHKRFVSFLLSVEPILVKAHGGFLFLQHFSDSPLFTQYVTIIYVVLRKACTEVTLSLKKDKLKNFDLVELLAGVFFQMFTQRTV